jgi:thiol-disulfide isomerase/thioredoxin
MRLSVQPIRHSRLIATGTAASAPLLLFLGLEFGPHVFFLGNAVQQPIPAAGFAGSGSASSLVLSIFDEPRALPEIRFQDDQGHDLTLADFQGRVLPLNVWATWCVPCRKEMPTLDRLQSRFGGKDVQVIALSIDRNGIEAVKDFYREVGVGKLAIYLDPLGKGTHDLAIPRVPTTLLIDRDGREVARKLGEAEWDSPELVSLVEKTIHAQSASNADITSRHQIRDR